MRRHNPDHEVSTGKRWLNICGLIIAHLTIVLSGVLAIIYACDLFNRGEMGLLNNHLTKALLLALCILAFAGALIHISNLHRLSSLRKYFKLLSRNKH